MQNRIIKKLSHQSTWQLFFLGLITYGIYWAYYVKRQTETINSHLVDKDRIPDGFVMSLLALSYVTLILLFAYVLVEEGHPVDLVSDLLDLVWTIMMLVWGFMARDRMNALNPESEAKKFWFNGFWTFMFTPLYFNYKVNEYAGKIPPDVDFEQPTANTYEP